MTFGTLGYLDYLAAGGAALAAGVINAVAGGGTLVSFPALVALGVPAVDANVTNTVALLPGYLAGSWAQRDDLRPQLRRAPALGAVAAAGGLVGSIVLVITPEKAFRLSVPYLILLSCVLLLAQDRVRDWLRRTQLAPAGADGAALPGSGSGLSHHGVALLVTVFVASVYGGFFGAGLGIMLLALLGLFTADALARVNALKQALSFVINLVAAGFFAFTGHVRWELVPVMAVASLVGGHSGGRLAQVIDATVLRWVVVVIGVGVAISFWVG